MLRKMGEIKISELRAMVEKNEIPCDYDELLNDLSNLKITSEDGNGVEAYAVRS